MNKNCPSCHNTKLKKRDIIYTECSRCKSLFAHMNNRLVYYSFYVTIDNNRYHIYAESGKRVNAGNGTFLSMDNNRFYEQIFKTDLFIDYEQYPSLQEVIKKLVKLSIFQ